MVAKKTTPFDIQTIAGLETHLNGTKTRATQTKSFAFCRLFHFAQISKSEREIHLDV